MHIRLVVLTGVVFVCTAVLLSATKEATAAESLSEETRTRLGIAGTRFTINGEPTFLYGASYYGALGAKRQFVISDLDDMQQRGLNWIRVWATWSAFDNDVSAVDEEGWTREPFMKELKWLVAECDRRGIVVDEVEHR